MRAGDLRERVGFYRRIQQSDGRGNTEAGFENAPQVQCAASIRPRLGGEQVLAGRLTGVNAVNIVIRRSQAAAAIDPTWKARDERRGVDYAIRSIIDPDQANAQRGTWIELLCEEGPAA